MAINVNIDDQLALDYKFKIADKQRELTFTDECSLEMQKVQLKVGKLMQGIEDIDEDKFDAETVEEQLKFVSDKYKQVRTAIMTFFDKYFGKGSGKEIYEFYHESTRALANVFGKIVHYLEKVDKNSKPKDK